MAGCKHCSIDHDYFDGEFSRHRCSTANDEIVRLTRELEVERMCHQSASNANHDKRLEVDRLRAALERLKLPEFDWQSSRFDRIEKILRGAAETTAGISNMWQCPSCRTFNPLLTVNCQKCSAVKTEGANT